MLNPDYRGGYRWHDRLIYWLHVRHMVRASFVAGCDLRKRADPEFETERRGEMTSPQEELLEAAIVLVDKLDQVEPHIDSTIGLNFARTQKQYAGPNYAIEKQRLLEAIVIAKDCEPPQSIANRYYLLGLHCTGPKHPEPCAPPYQPLKEEAK